VSFIDGRLGDVATIAHVPGEFSRQIDSLSSDLQCERTYAIKLFEKHKLPYEKFQLIQPAIDFGHVRLVRKDLEFVYYDDADPGPPYLLVVKAVGRSELWLRTFYRAERWKEESLLRPRRGRLLRVHAGIE
jgi:hypothetical protein